MGTQIEIAKTITERGGDYLLSLKANWPALMAEVETFFADPENRPACEACDTVDADHGRLEQRHHRVCRQLDWLKSDRRHPDQREFPALTTIAMVEATTVRNGKTEHERRYYLSSASLDAKAFAAAVRANWGIENRLHWVLDSLPRA